MVDGRLRWVFDDLPFELDEEPKDGKKKILRGRGNRRHLCLNFGLDASIGIVDNDKVGNQTQGDNL
jgi:hypothetical protein